jgi:hypothetical protein
MNMVESGDGTPIAYARLGRGPPQSPLSFSVLSVGADQAGPVMTKKSHASRCRRAAAQIDRGFGETRGSSAVVVEGVIAVCCDT